MTKPQDTDEDDHKLEDEEEVETPDTQDEDDTSEDDEENEDDSDTGDEDEGDDDDSDDDESEDEDKKPKFKKQFSQFKGDTPEEYIPNVEEGYRKSSQEAKRLAQQNKELQGRMDAVAEAVAKNPDLAKAIADATGDKAVPVTVDPALTYARQKQQEDMTKEYDDFVLEHPELVSDEEVQEKVLKQLEVFGAAARAEGRVLSMKEGLRMSYSFLGLDQEDSKEKIAGAAKDTASRSKNSSSNKKGGATTSELTPDQIAWGKKMGLSEKDMVKYSKKK